MVKNLHISKWLWLTIAISLISFIAKISGLDWGFPATLHNDESNVIRSAMGMRFGDLNPHHFDWPSLYFYINYFAFAGFIKFRILLQILFSTETMQKAFPFWWQADLPFYYISRIISNLFLLINIVSVYFVAKETRLTNKIAFLASTIFTVGFLTNYFSFYGISDTALTFFITITGYFSLRIINHSKYSDYIFAGIFAGLATSIKYNAALMCILILVAHLIHKKKFDIFNIKLISSAIASIAFFFIGTPYAILDYKNFSRTDDYHGAFWQIQHMGRAANWFYHLFETTPQNFGWLGTIVGFAAIYLAIKSKNKNYIYIIITYLVLVLYIGSWGITRSHYSLPMFPFFAVMIAISIFEITKNLNKNIFYILVICILIPPFLNSSAEVIKRNNTDTRISSGNWINQNIQKESNLISTRGLTEYFGGDRPVYDYRNYKNTQVSLNEDILQTERNNYLIVINDEKFERYKYDELIYEENNKWTTGPNIKIYKLDN